MIEGRLPKESAVREYIMLIVMDACCYDLSVDGQDTIRPSSRYWMLLNLVSVQCYCSITTTTLCNISELLGRTCAWVWCCVVHYYHLLLLYDTMLLLDHAMVLLHNGVLSWIMLCNHVRCWLLHTDKHWFLVLATKWLIKGIASMSMTQLSVGGT